MPGMAGLKGYLLFGGAAALYLTAVGCVIWPDKASSKPGGDIDAPAQVVAGRPNLEGLPYRGASLQIQDVAKIEDYKKSIDSIAADGFDTVELVVSARQENGTSARIFLDLRLTPTGDQLAALIQHAKEKKLRVVLMPIVLLEAPRGNEWRGTIKPEVWEEWFDSYREMEDHYAAIAEDNHVDLLVVGSELVSTETHESEWEKTIAAIRERFHGKLTYSSNWDHYTSVGFWNKLDLIGMNSYWKLGEDHKVPIKEIEERWRGIQKDVLAFSNKQGKPIILLEVGWCSLANAANEPWDYTKTDEALDLEVQRKLYEGFFRSWWGNPNLGGFMIWEWALGEVQPDNKGYSPQSKPAEKVLEAWLAKGPWEVK
jgi:hypothetical protein